ncbi:DUF6221 family protein [Streptomyces sp. DE06-01C]|uniref:DUF6221 family protein n=1 Tax=Streptomyces sp. DE06-01C TaxID=3028656 RepID=UPI0029C38DFC|nr:DUF6221 family protein [Streptomyces sp. DE06-01C]MDX5526114.1 DUF6221 family protein [Streptomyces sp. DE06-01C]
MTAAGENVLAYLDRAITEREAAAQAAASFGDAFAVGAEAPDCVYGTGSGGPYMRVAVPGFEGQTEAAVAHFALHGPESVLRRCAADRKLIAALAAVINGDYIDDGEPVLAESVLCGIAEGYGRTEGER